MPLLLAVAAYARVLPGEFVFDDIWAIEQSGTLADLPSYLGAPFLHGFLHGGRPVADVLLRAGYAIGGVDPRPYHAIAIAIHLAAVVLAFLLARALVRLAGGERADGVALVAAGLFAVHPLQTQAVSYVVQLAETLASALYLATVLLLLAADRRGSTARRVALLAAGLLLFALALGSKAIATTAPVAFLLLVALVPGPAGRSRSVSWGNRLLGLAPFVAFDLWFSHRTVAVLEGHADAGFSVPGLPPVTYFVNQWRVVTTYLRLVAWPQGQNVDWALVPTGTLADPATLAAGLLLTVLLGGAVLLAVRARSRDGAAPAATRVAGAGVAWFFVLLAPTSTVVPLADLLMEHRVYLPIFGLLLALSALGERGVAALVPRLGARRAELVATMVVAIAWVSLAAATWSRNEVWVSRLAMWSDAAAKAPANPRAALGHGFALQKVGRHEEAIAEYRRALDLGGSTPELRRVIRRNLGPALAHAGRHDEAERFILQSMADDPGDEDGLVTLGLIAQRRGDLAGMERWGSRALEVNKDSAGGLELVGVARAARGDTEGALPLLARAERLDPADGRKSLSLGIALERAGRLPEACDAWGRALARGLEPSLQERVRRRRAELGCGG